MSSDSDRFLCLLDEMETSHKLIRAGFGSLQEIDMANDFYHLPHQLIASGLERLMKCYISLVYQDQTGAYPDTRYLMCTLGHDLAKMLQTIREQYYGGLYRPLVQEELDYLLTDTTLGECIRILTLFGKFARYYNLDIVGGSEKTLIDPKREWEALERSIEDPSPFLADTEALYRDYYPRVHSKLISKLERLVRAISLQFMIGDHADKFGNLRKMSSIFSDFRNLSNEQLGTTDYRQSVRILEQTQKNWTKRTKDEITNGEWPTRIVTKDEFGNEWPFRTNEIIVEMQERLFAVANIEGYAFALNGTAASHLKLPFPHDSGIAILGKSIGPFIDMAWSLVDNSR